jgi:transposase
LLVGLKPLQPRLELIWADRAYRGDALATWCATEGAWHVEIIKGVPHVQGFVVRPWCWIVERTLGWMGRQRRLSKDYERVSVHLHDQAMQPGAYPVRVGQAWEARKVPLPRPARPRMRPSDSRGRDGVAV